MPITRYSKSQKVLTSAEIEHFMDRGYVLLREAFSPVAASKVTDQLWPLLDLKPDDPSGWTKPHIRIERSFKGPAVDACITDRFLGAVDDLLGEGNHVPLDYLGGWPILFPGFTAGPWQPPIVGWHVDGSHFHHHIDSKVQGLLPIFIFSDIGPGDGGTAFRPGSHKVTARVLADAEPDGLEVNELAARTNDHNYTEVIEANGSIGDVLLLHPFMSHSVSMNCGNKVRIICNPCLSLREPMNLQRPRHEDYTPLERSIVEAIGG